MSMNVIKTMEDVIRSAMIMMEATHVHVIGKGMFFSQKMEHQVTKYRTRKTVYWMEIFIV